MNIISLRRKAKLSREKAAAKIGVSLSTLGRWEKGLSKIPLDILPIIKNVYKIDDADILQFCHDLEEKEGA